LAAALGALAASSFPQQQQQQPASRSQFQSHHLGWRGGAATGYQICDQEAARVRTPTFLHVVKQTQQSLSPRSTLLQRNDVGCWKGVPLSKTL